ncbi:hypothetical protein GCM10010431_68070 [Streptomyces kunmingensis]
MAASSQAVSPLSREGAARGRVVAGMRASVTGPGFRIRTPAFPPCFVLPSRYRDLTVLAGFADQGQWAP